MGDECRGPRIARESVWIFAFPLSLSLSLNLDNLTGFNIILMALQSDGQTRGVVTAECQPRSIKKRNDQI